MFNSRIIAIPLAALLLCGAARSFGQTVPPASKAEVDKRIAIVQSEATRKEKIDALRELSFIATKETVPALAALLGDAELSHMARYAMEPIPDPSIDDAFRAALDTVKGRQLVGVIGSIGARRDAKGVQPLEKLLGSDDVEVALATARALGNIGTKQATSALQKALPNATGQMQLHVCEGLFRCAEALVAKGQKDAAIEIYDQMRALKAAPHQVRGGALRGAILARSEADGVKLLAEHLQSEDYILFSAATQTALEMPGAAVTKALTGALKQLPADNQIVVIQTLGQRADKGATEAMCEAAQSGDKAVRLVAIRVLPALRDGAAAPALAKLMGDGDGEIAQAAQQSLAALPGKEADAAVLALLDSGDAGQRLTGLELIGRRRMTACVPAVLKATGDADGKVRQAALKQTGDLGDSSALPPLLDRLMQLTDGKDLDAAAKAAIAIGGKGENPPANAGKVIGLMSQAKPAQKGALLSILGAVGGAQALEAVRAALKDSDAGVKDSAVRALAAWKTGDAAPDLLALAKSAPNQTHKVLALRGYIGAIRAEGLSVEKKLAMADEAAKLVKSNDEKKQLLGALGDVPAAEALAMVMAHLDNQATANEATAAAVAIGEKISQSHPEEVRAALQKVMKATKNKGVTRRARTVLDKLK